MRNQALGPCKIGPFWEVWRVTNGAIEGGAPSDTFRLPDMTQRVTDDGEPYRECLRGNTQVRGWARFVDIDEITPAERNLPPTKPLYWQAGAPCAATPACSWLQFLFSSGSLKHTTRNPGKYGFWDNDWVDAVPAEVVFHSLRTSWNCCPGPCTTDCPNNPSDVTISPEAPSESP